MKSCGNCANCNKIRDDFWACEEYGFYKNGFAPVHCEPPHGGVANLLKVLTKTMVQRGTSLDTIAKTQWSVCRQAGIYIPNEFLTDVSTLIDYNDQMRALDKEV